MYATTQLHIWETIDYTYIYLSYRWGTIDYIYIYLSKKKYKAAAV